MVPPRRPTEVGLDISDRISRVPPYSISPRGRFRLRDYHPLWCDFPDTSTSVPRSLRAVPLSLVATEGISVDFFSSGYLDISVPRVRLTTLCIQVAMTPKGRVSPFGNPRVITPVCRLPEAYRRLPRPSSPPAA
jgi:hypothetical protein